MNSNSPVAQPGSSIAASGKYQPRIDQAQDVHIGDRYYQTDPDTIKRIVQAELRLPQTDYSQPVNLGLTALADLMQIPAARVAVTQFQADFLAACEQIDRIANYKALHDLLHTLEFQCYSSLLQEARRFPDDDTAIEILSDYHLTLQTIVADVDTVSHQNSVAPQEVLWLQDLQRAEAELQGAIAQLDTRRLQRTIWLLNRVLAIQPSRINTSLNIAARALRLPALVKAMTEICTKLTGSQLNPEKIEQFQTGVTALGELNQRLAALVISHDYWQEFDLEVRRIEANLDQDLTELELSWPDLRDRTRLLFDHQEDDWAKAFQQDCTHLDAALQEQNPVKIKRCFRLYRRRAGDRFYQVDVTLKRLCDELRKVGAPLASILRILE